MFMIIHVMDIDVIRVRKYFLFSFNYIVISCYYTLRVYLNFWAFFFFFFFFLLAELNSSKILLKSLRGN